MTDGVGTTITVDATGVVALIEQGLEFTANEGKVILLGVAPADAALQVPIVSFMVVCGSFVPEKASPVIAKADLDVDGKEAPGKHGRGGPSPRGGLDGCFLTKTVTLKRRAKYIPRMI